MQHRLYSLESPLVRWLCALGSQPRSGMVLLPIATGKAIGPIKRKRKLQKRQRKPETSDTEESSAEEESSGEESSEEEIQEASVDESSEEESEDEDEDEDETDPVAAARRKARRKAKSKVRRKKEKRRRKKAAVKVQASMRGRQVRMLTQKQQAAATQVQASVRGRKVRKQMEEQQIAAVKVQTIIRGKQARSFTADVVAAKAARMARLRFPGHFKAQASRTRRRFREMAVETAAIVSVRAVQPCARATTAREHVQATVEAHRLRELPCIKPLPWHWHMNVAAVAAPPISGRGPVVLSPVGVQLPPRTAPSTAPRVAKFGAALHGPYSSQLGARRQACLDPLSVHNASTRVRDGQAAVGSARLPAAARSSPDHAASTAWTRRSWTLWRERAWLRELERAATCGTIPVPAVEHPTVTTRVGLATTQSSPGLRLR